MVRMAPSEEIATMLAWEAPAALPSPAMALRRMLAAVACSLGSMVSRTIRSGELGPTSFSTSLVA